MDLRQCLDNLKHDLGNGGIKDDTFPVVCYVTMANKAKRLLKSDTLDQQARNDASEFLSVCSKSGSDSLRYIAGG